MIRVHATKASINGYKVRLLLSMLRQPYELVELDMYGGEHKREPFLTLNPFGQMPALTDGDVHDRGFARVPRVFRAQVRSRPAPGCRRMPKARRKWPSGCRSRRTKCIRGRG